MDRTPTAPPGDATAPAAAAPLGADASAPPGLSTRPSFFYNVAAQTIYTFALGGLAAWMPTYFFRERGLPLGEASLIFGAIVCLSGLLGTLAGGQLGDALAKRSPSAHFTVSGLGLVASLPFTLLAVLAPSPAIFWPAMFATLTLLVLNTAPLTAAMANVLPPELRGLGFGINTMAIHILGDAFSPLFIGMASDRLGGLRWPVMVTGSLLVASGITLLAGRGALARDLRAAGAA
jgi:MFS family permease